MKRPICKACGACCTWWVYFEDRKEPLRKEMIDRMKCSGVRSFAGQGKDGEVRAIYVPNRCYYLDKDSKCKLHQRKKPLMCRRFPRKGMCYILPDSCTFVKKEADWYGMKDFREEF